MTMIRMDSDRILEEAVERSHDEPVVLYKHSATCSLSFSARKEMTRLSQDGSMPPVYELVVQYDRALSNAIEETYGIRHESPQVILLFKNRPVFNTSHRGVTADTVRQALLNVPRQEAA